MRSLIQIITSDPDCLVQLYGPDAQPSTIAATFHRLADDLAYFQAEGHPPADVLDESPLLENWYAAFSPLGVVLVGEIMGHSVFHRQTRRTSPIWVIDRDLRWTRTLNRLYRLGDYVGSCSELQN